MYKNVAGQHIVVYATTRATGLPATNLYDELAAYISKDGGPAVAASDELATELSAANLPGYYAFDLTQEETNADLIVFRAFDTAAPDDYEILPVILYTIDIPAASENAAAVLASTVDTLTLSKVLQALLAVACGKAVVSGSTVSFKGRDGSTEVVAVTGGSAAGERIVSTVT